MIRKPLELAYLLTANPLPNASASHGISESAPRFRCTTRYAAPPALSRGSQAISSVCSASLPMRIGGFDQITSNFGSAGIGSAPDTCCSARGAPCSSVCAMRMRSQPLRFALPAVSSSARSFTSTAHTSASGDSIAIANATGPQPQPRSRNVPCSGSSGAWRSSTEVPRSSREPENTPFEVSTSASNPRSVTCSVRRTSCEAGVAEKYCSLMVLILI